MKRCFVLVLCAISSFSYAYAELSEEDVKKTCCSHGRKFARGSGDCNVIEVPEDLQTEDPVLLETCSLQAMACCQHEAFSGTCTNGMKYAEEKRCEEPDDEIGKTCCEECSLGRWAGESQGKEGCKSDSEDYFDPMAMLRKDAYFNCCQKAAEEAERTTEAEPETSTKRLETTTEKRVTTTEKRVTTTEKKVPREKCKADSCDQVCNDEDGRVRCQCHEGYRLQGDKKTCKDINECAEAIDDLCIAKDTVCHNVDGSFKCVPIKKRDVGLTCPPGFKRNVQNQVCDDINECQLPRPPCPKYLCENTIGGFKCAGKPGKPFQEDGPVATTPPPAVIDPPKTDICPPGFRAGADDECLDIDECDERLDDCQRLSQHCINTHGSFFCQDHVSKRCAPGFKVNPQTGICEDIDECEESAEVCKRSEVCVNLPGAYNCKSKISTLPKLGSSSRICQEGTRLKPGGSVCEDIDECREGTHLCDNFQNCINTYGAHECRCKSGFELDSNSGSCVDIDECGLKLDNCGPDLQCSNILGSFTCSRRPPTTSTRRPPTTSTVSEFVDYYYDSDEDTQPSNSVNPPSPPTYATYPTVPSSRQTTRRNPYTNRPAPRVTSAPTTEPTTTPEATEATPPEAPKESDTYSPYVPRPPSLPPRPDERPPRPDERPPRPDERPPRPHETPRRPVYRPTRPTERPRRPQYSPPTTEPSSTPETLTEVSVLPPDNPDLLEKDRNPDGSYAVNTSDIPKDTWTNVIGRDKPEESDFDVNNVHCLYGLQRDANGNCVDVNECETNRHICSGLEVCVNMEGGYRCDCVPGYHRDPSDWCVPLRPPPPPTTPRATTTERTTTSTTTTERSTERTVTTPRPWNTPPGRPRRPVIPPTSCDTGFAFNSAVGECVDIDECTIRNVCDPNEECHNVDGGFYCRCGAKCRAAAAETPAYATIYLPEPLHPSPRDPYPESSQTSPRPRDPYPESSQPAPRPRDPYPESTQPEPRPRDPYPESSQTSPRPRDPYPESSQPAPRPRDPYPESTQPEPRPRDPYPESSQTSPRPRDPYPESSQPSPRPRDPYPESTQPAPRPRDPYPVASPPAPYPRDPHPRDPESTIITVGAQYGQRGPRILRPTFTRLPNTGVIVTSCPWGYKLTPDKRCYDIDECAKNVSRCGPQQRCENFFGGYSCQCPAGHKLYGKDGCQDIDECRYGSPCGYNSKCVNTVGSYHCECGDGFRNSPSNDKVCVDIDECSETPGVCQQNCANSWGGYRCYCKRGYRLGTDNKTCADVDECAEWGSSRLRGRLCGGNCLNEPGSYRCTCPAGYRLGDDGKSCIDIDECESGEAPCARAHDPGHVCQNTRGGYHCHRINCPQGYKLEANHRCSRIQRSCPVTDWGCLQRPTTYSYNFITFVANIYMPTGSVDLFTMHGPAWRDSIVSFELSMIDVQAGAGVKPAELRCFDMRPMDNVCVISLLCPLAGPQVAELELTMSLYQRGQFAGNAVARLIIIVSQYEF